MNRLETHNEPWHSRQPTSAYIVVAMWAVLEIFFVVMTDGESRRSGDPFQTIVRPLIQGGVFASFLMVIAWLIYGTNATIFAPRPIIVYGFLCAFGGVIAVMVFMLFFVSLTGTVQNQDRLLASSLMATAGVVVPMLLIRNYFGFRLVHQSREAAQVLPQSEVSIRRLMVITALLACLLGTCRMLVGGLDYEILTDGVFGFLCALIWWATAIWMLGRRVYIAVTLSVFAIVEVTGIALSWPDIGSNGDEAVMAFTSLLGVQLHLLLFFSVLLAGQFRFARIQAFVRS